MRDALETIEGPPGSGLRALIYPNEDAEPPDSWGDDSVLLVTTSNRYFERVPKGWDPASSATPKEAKRRGYHCLPLYMYAHSGVALSLGRGYPFNCPWDSGQVGYCLVQKNQGFRNIQKTAAGYVETWNQLLSGEVYGVVIEQEGEHVDSCWGFYGREYAEEEARRMLAGAVREREKVGRMEESCYAR